jgi:hypothetical protein
MNPFPETILTPSSAHRLPTELHQELIDQLVEHGINAAGFLMDGDLLRDLAKLEHRPFHNDSERAERDLADQIAALSNATFVIPELPKVFRDKHWPPQPYEVKLMESCPDGSGSGSSGGDDGSSGMASGQSIGSPGDDGGRKRRRDAEEQQERSRGQSMGI